ncbi:hypothetical protein CEXT_470611 [Caerostris extrusa]|uniref:Uncharacterized protein n=1 Tax=Caerostris extrusa TaxID=172846 RepID=A0AAV4NYM5_CAEEX|nr:hypothetical protein CEXT_470611 [Caerostris extrusa]
MFTYKVTVETLKNNVIANLLVRLEPASYYVFPSRPIRLEPAYYVFPPDPSDWNLHTTSFLQTRPTGTCILRLASDPGCPRRSSQDRMSGMASVISRNFRGRRKRDTMQFHDAV